MYVASDACYQNKTAGDEASGNRVNSAEPPSIREKMPLLSWYQKRKSF